VSIVRRDEEDLTMPTDDELVSQGMAIFRGIVGRSRVGLCAKKIARDRYCPARKATDLGLFCERHRRQAEDDDRRVEALMVEGDGQ
jgi:hypothetical protein